MIKGFINKLKYEAEKYVNNKVKNKLENKTGLMKEFIQLGLEQVIFLF